MQKVIRTGHSLAVVIPQKVARLMGIKAGDKVKLKTLSEKAEIRLLFSGLSQLPLSLSKTRKKH